MPRFAKASLLLFFLSLCAAALVVTHRVRARRPAPAPHELFTVVNQQLAAVRAEDFPGAYRYASVGVQQKFTLYQFEKMVRRSYAEMAAAHRVEFGSVSVHRGTAFVQVFFFAADGSARSFLYSLTPEGARWKISGVEELDHYHPTQRLSGTNV